jgi:uncharacterized protein (TIGR03086 family)
MTAARAEWGDEVRVLARALDQAGDVLDHVTRDRLRQPTPCHDWDLATLLDHLLDAPRRFLAMMRGEQVDWAAAPPRVAEEWGPAFRVAADDLIHAWHEHSDSSPVPADWQTAELAAHTWDVAVAIGWPTARLDREVAQRALAFMHANLTDENRGPAFGPPAPAPAGSGPYEELAAYAGRSVV